jgi:hypothetical protein
MLATKQRRGINRTQIAMMKRSTRYVAACLTLLVIAGVVAGYAFLGAPNAGTIAVQRVEASKPAQIDEIRGYRSWTLVNPQPVAISPKASSLCAAQLPANLNNDAQNPHLHKLISVYVNDTGRRAMMNERYPKFAVGSVIVKEKLPLDKGSEPELLTVMIKRERGFNPASGDWEYMVVDGTGTKAEARGKLENCQACHVPLKYTDYVSRSYMPLDVRGKLR